MTDRIPTFACKSGCNACCGLTVFSASERDEAAKLRPLEQWEPFQNGFVLVGALATMSCPMLTANGCGIYEVRPVICRLFGAVDDPMLTCPHGGPKRKLTKQQGRVIQMDAFA